MPRIRQNADQYRKADFQKVIDHSKIDAGFRTDKAIAEEAGIPNTTFYKRMRDPDTFTLEEFRRFLKTVPVPCEAVLSFLGYSRKDIQKTEETA